MHDPILSVQNLKVAFPASGGWKPMLNGISFDVRAGETLAIVGETGSGKSVTALSIMGLHPKGRVQHSGRIEFCGKDLLQCSEREMRRICGNEIAMIFQEPMTSLNPVLTIGRQLGEALLIHRGLKGASARKEAAQLLDKVRIPAAASRLDDYPHQFSGGMRQRVMIAMALACRPKLLIADEPTTALDVTIQAQIIDILAELQREEGMAVMFITHDMGVVAEIADRTLVLFRGDVQEVEATTELFRNPQTKYARSLLAAVPKLGAMSGRDAPAPFPIIDPDTGIARDEIEAVRPDTRKEPVLDVKGLSTRFDVSRGFFGRPSGRVHAVENVTFSLREGETLSLVGESGCGKSTTGRSIMRLLRPAQGSVRLDGAELLAGGDAAMQAHRHKIQMIFQDPFASLNPRMKVGHSIAEPMVVNGMVGRRGWRDRVAALLEEVGLQPDMMERYPHEFSGGQRQRICIARALSVQPKVIVADEAVSALDVSVKAQVVNLMMQLQEKAGVAFLFISHDMAVVERVSHRVAVMFLGEIVEIGNRADIFANPQHPYTKRLLSAVPVADPRARHQRTQVPDMEIRSPIRSLDYVPPKRSYTRMGDDHLVMDWRDDPVWMNAPASPSRQTAIPS